jgi:hypothetical protein
MDQTIVFQRVEGMAICLASTILYFWLDYSGWVFLVLLFSFDVFMLGYLVNRRVGAFVYNAGHSFLWPACLLAFALPYGSRSLVAFSVIWLAHIGLDRALGYGLKFSSGFTDTHLGKIGRQPWK